MRHLPVRSARRRISDAKSKAARRARAAHAFGKRLFRINLANTLTLLNAVSGFLSVLSSMQGEFVQAALFIMIGVFFDWFDGKAARFFDEESALGAELDSLSDLVSFGVAPAVLVVAIAPSSLSIGAGALFVLSAALRLARFNVQDLKGVFFGMPTTANGILLPLFVLGNAPHQIYPWYLLGMAFLMNSPLRVKKVI